MRLTTLLVLIFLNSCNTKTNRIANNINRVKFQFKAIQNKEVLGSVLVYDLNKDTYYSNDFDWSNTGRIPASTFKIPHSLIALDLGIIPNETSIIKWNGEKRAFKMWQQDLSFRKAFHYSCVPCFQQIATKIGISRMNIHIDKFEYGEMDINTNNIDKFWLIGQSKINQFEEIDFLKKLHLSKLPISQRAEQIFKQMFITKQTDNYTLRAKTGLAVQDENYNGWYVGYLTTSNNTYFFATNISPKGKYDNSFNNKRKNITIMALQELKIIE